MAIISSNTQAADVQAAGAAMDATMEFSGALMEMMATVYSYILMSSIREALQNGCDAVKRAGISFADGVMVLLPTPSNPMITIIDKGSGMTKEFMNTKYLSFGSSTKAGDNGSAGGLGVGRWAAYGYIRECYITTCHASDMMERTYFQFQGPNGKPQVQPAAEVPGTEVGTRVQFPVKESDLDEALRAVAWLKEVMQLTMGDSFSVDNPAALPTMLPLHCGTVLTLDAEDPGLKGVRIYPMKGNLLKYGRDALKDGSLVVLTNQEAGVGGLPFHVQSPSNAESVFHNGMVVEIPMSFGVAFMPSREEIKYTDEVTALLKRIDAAAAKAVVSKARELYTSPDLACKAQLSELLGNEPSETWHWFARASRISKDNDILFKPLSAATGGSSWQGSLKIGVVSEMRSRTLTVKSTSVDDTVLRDAFSDGGHLAVSLGKSGASYVKFHPNTPIALVVNDVKSGGTARFRNWLSAMTGKRKFIYMSSNVAGEAQAAVDALNAVYGGALEVFRTSAMPAVARVVVGSKVVAVARARGAAITYFSCSEGKQLTDMMGFATHSSREPMRVWIGKDGGALHGFKETTNLAKLCDRWGTGNLMHVLKGMRIDRLYLLTPKQAGELAAAKASVQADGLWELSDDEFGDDADGQEAMRAVKALKSWTTLEDFLSEVLGKKLIQDVLAGRKVHTVKENHEFNQLCEALAQRPRMELTGTSLDKAFAPHVDLLSGVVRINYGKLLSNDFRQLCDGLTLLGENLEVSETDSDDRKELVANLKRVKAAGFIDYNEINKDLRSKFPMLLAIGQLHTVPAHAFDDLCRALAVVYR